MSSDEGSDNEINFNALVGNILNSHEELKDDDNAFEVDHANTDTHNIEKLTMDHELPEFVTEDVDLEAVVNAIQDFNENNDTTNKPHTESEAEKHNLSANNEDQQWAHTLQHSLLQTTDTQHSNNKGHTVDDELDQDDMNLRNAILDSLQQLNKEDIVPKKKNKSKTSATAKKPKAAKKSKTTLSGESTTTLDILTESKKREPKKKKDKSKGKTEEGTTKKKTKKSRKKDDTANDDSLLNFEDVIKGFMQQDDVNEKKQGADSGDFETQALVEATLKAFEKELMGSKTPKPPSKPKKSTTKRKITEKVLPQKTSITAFKEKVSNKSVSASKDSATSSKTKAPSALKKKKKKDKKSEDISYEDDDFSKALAEMVNQVVNTSISDKSSRTVADNANILPSTTEAEARSKPHMPQETEATGDDNFDLNQIMQRALALAFQEQPQHDIDQSVVDDFNKGLDDFGVSDILIPTSGKTKQKKAEPKKKVPKVKVIQDKVKTKRTPKVKEPKKKKIVTPKVHKLKKIKALKPVKVKSYKSQLPFKFPKPSKRKKTLIDITRKRYRKLAIEAANIARQKLRDNKQALKDRLKSEQVKISEERKLRKVQEREKLEKEKKELEDIVAKGPPYPTDLRLTKRGEPKKPYRRWTPEEIAIRAQMPVEEPKKPKKIKKPKKKKSKKLKKVSLSTLRKIPLFNISKEGSNINLGSSQSSSIPLNKYRMELNRLAPPSSIAMNDLANEGSSASDVYKSRVVQEKLLIFDPTAKTVVRKEKWVFHPPWILPLHPPFALPVARRKGKTFIEKLKDTKNKLKSKKTSKHLRSALTNHTRNNIIPSILFPIINTLKAAARAKVAAGASPEEATRHMMTIIQHTKRSIAQSLAISRRNVTRDYSSLRTEEDVKSSSKKRNVLKKIPIFSLSAIRKVNTAETDYPTKVKLENENDSKILRTTNQRTGIDNSSSNEGLLSSHEGSQTNNKEDVSNISESDRQFIIGDYHENMKMSEIHDKSTEEAHNFTSISNIPKSSILYIDPILEQLSANDSKQNNDEKSDVEVLNLKSTTEKDSTTQNIDSSLNNSAVESTVVPNNSDGTGESIALIDHEKNLNGSKDNTQDDVLITRINQTSKQPPIVVKKETQSLSDNMKEIVQSLVQKHIEKSNNDENDVVLPTDITNMISSTISTLLPALDNTNTKEQDRRTYTKPPPPILNIDGLIPPNRIITPTIRRESPLRIIKPEPNSSINDFRQNHSTGSRKKAATEQPKYLNRINFDIPKNAGNKRSGAVKYARLYLNSEEMSSLTKEINKERKRKWRSANTIKNWENDVRARLKKRSKTELSGMTNDQRADWIASEFQKRKSEFMVKNEVSPDVAASLASNNANVGSSNITENEVLNMIANILNKEEIARKIERNLIEDVKRGSVTMTKRKNMDDQNNQSMESTLA